MYLPLSLEIVETVLRGCWADQCMASPVFRLGRLHQASAFNCRHVHSGYSLVDTGDRRGDTAARSSLTISCRISSARLSLISLMSSCRWGLSALPPPPPPLSLPLSSSRWGSTAALPPPTSSSPSSGPCTGSAWSEHWDAHVAAPGRGGGAGVRETEARYIPVFWGRGRDSSGVWDGPGWRPEDLVGLADLEERPELGVGAMLAPPSALLS